MSSINNSQNNLQRFCIVASHIKTHTLKKINLKKKKKVQITDDNLMWFQVSSRHIHIIFQTEEKILFCSILSPDFLGQMLFSPLFSSYLSSLPSVQIGRTRGILLITFTSLSCLSCCVACASVTLHVKLANNRMCHAP